MELLHFLSITKTPMCGRFIVGGGEERVARVTNDPLLSPESRSVTVITGTQLFICKKEEKEEMCGLFIPSVEFYSNGWKIVWPKPLCSKTDFCFVNLR